MNGAVQGIIRVRRGRCRIEWQVSCGDGLHSVFDRLRPGSVDDGVRSG